jgi:hypothetical protein
MKKVAYPLEEDYNKRKGSQNGTTYGYSVEACYTYYEPIQIGGQIFDNRWREVKFEESIIGVPGGEFKHINSNINLLSYSSAQALRWWLHSIADKMFAVCLLTRIVIHKIEFSYNITATEYCDIHPKQDKKENKNGT